MKGIVVKKTLKNRDNTSRMYILPSTFDVKAYWEAAYSEGEEHTLYEIEIYAEEELILEHYLLINMQDSDFIIDHDNGEYFEMWVDKDMRDTITNDIAKFIVLDKETAHNCVLDLDSMSCSWQKVLDKLLLRYKKAINEFGIKK